MQSKNGVLIVIEGTDGTGKSTQVDLLRQRLVKAGHDVAFFKFPRYDEPSSYFIREYLQGSYGAANDVGPYAASLFYALDRYQASFAIRKELAAGKVVLCDRFSASNMAHQGTKFTNIEERRGYFLWIDNLEFEILHIPRPTLTLVLNTPLVLVEQRVAERPASSAHIKKDVHEASAEHLKRSYEVYLDLCQLFPKDFTRIDCVRGDALLSVAEIGNLLWQKVAPLLPPPDEHHPKATAAEASAAPSTATNNPYITATAGHTQITEAGYDYLRDVVTDPRGQIYAFTNQLSPIAVAAAMARLSQRGDDLRVTVLDEFALAQDAVAKPVGRATSASGDDSVNQLAGMHMAVERASLLLAKKIEQGRPYGCLEQSPRHVYFDQKDEQGHYRYFVPPELPPDIAAQYRASMDTLFDQYAAIVRQLIDHLAGVSVTPAKERDAIWRAAVRAEACDAAQAVLPIATTTTIGMFASGQALESLVRRLLGDELPEAQRTGSQLLDEARKIMPDILEGAANAYRPATHTAVQQLAEHYLPANHADRQEAITLSSFWPRNELDLVPDLLYEHSDQPLATIKKEVDRWPYDRKAAVLQTYIGGRADRRHKPGGAFEKVHYRWDVISDFAVFTDLQRHRVADHLAWQALSPRYGFDTPQLIEDAGLSEPFEACFDASLRLYSLLQANGYAREAQYATLQGHNMRWTMTLNAREACCLLEPHTGSQEYPACRQLIRQMYRKLAEVHPLLAAGMRLVKQDEDPERNRPAAR
ncbi:MAG TPA: FAD-dependent thymidylate synthase [Candidatus Saccharimonadales bacterium]|nr:FAD-dependent thymidylate synthase [Candidatus Saccharimonadales bacterium]